VRGAVGQDDRELLAADPGDQVHGPHGLGDGPRHGADDLIAGAVAIGVIDGLEMIDVEHQQQRRLARSGHPVGLARQRHLEAAPVHEAGQRVLARQVAECVQHRLQPRSTVRRLVREQGPGLLQQLQGLIQIEHGGVDHSGCRRARFQKAVVF